MLREIIAAQSADVALHGLVTSSACSAGMWIRHEWAASSGLISREMFAYKSSLKRL
jgi:hypothetical protein